MRMAKHSTSAIQGMREPEGKYLTGKTLSELQRLAHEWKTRGKGGGETNKSTIGIYACISDERAGGAGAKRVV